MSLNISLVECFRLSSFNLCDIHGMLAFSAYKINVVNLLYAYGMYVQTYQIAQSDVLCFLYSKSYG